MRTATCPSIASSAACTKVVEAIDYDACPVKFESEQDAFHDCLFMVESRAPIEPGGEAKDVPVKFLVPDASRMALLPHPSP